MKRCSRCGEEKSLDDFSPHRTSRDGRQSTCRPCATAAKTSRRQQLRNRTDEELDQAFNAAGNFKRCCHCQQVKSKNEFTRDRGRADTLAASCRPCAADKSSRDRPARPEVYRERRKAEYGRNRDRYRAQAIKKRFGITVDQYDAMLQAQEGVCAICRQPERAVRHGRVLLLSVDHDHKTGAVRQMLCQACNRGLGFFGDDPERLVSAAHYLRMHSLLSDLADLEQHLTVSTQ